jgi:hypothetical protein
MVEDSRKAVCEFSDEHPLDPTQPVGTGEAQDERNPAETATQIAISNTNDDDALPYEIVSDTIQDG